MQKDIVELIAEAVASSNNLEDKALLTSCATEIESLRTEENSKIAGIYHRNNSDILQLQDIVQSLTPPEGMIAVILTIAEAQEIASDDSNPISSYCSLALSKLDMV